MNLVLENQMTACFSEAGSGRPRSHHGPAVAMLVCLSWMLALVACTPPEPEADGEPAAVGESEEASSGKTAEDLIEEQARALREIGTLGYVSGMEQAIGPTGVIQYDPERTAPGFNFYNSAHDHEAYLIDMEGKVLHQWEGSWRAFEHHGEPRPRGRLSHMWRRAKLLRDGSIIAIQENVGLVKLDRNSELVWSVVNYAHHDLDLDEAGRIYSLCRESEDVERFSELSPVLIDYVRIHDDEGALLESVSIDEAYAASEFPVPTSPGDPLRDIYHTNTIQLLSGELEHLNAAFRKSNLLLSFHCLDEIAILDMEQRKIVWRLRGPWEEQHEPSLLGNGNVLLFDNIGMAGKDGPARALEYDPIGQSIVWAFSGPEDALLVSHRAGTTTRLANGNTLIVSSAQGRTVEVTPSNDIVWEYLSPHITGRRSIRRAGFFEFERIDPEFVSGWMGAGNAPLTKDGGTTDSSLETGSISDTAL